VRVDGDEIVLGRSKDCDVVINERFVSSRHAKILMGLVVADLDSLNGTYLEGERVREATPIRGRTLRLGGDDDDVQIDVSIVSDESPDDLNPLDAEGAKAATAFVGRLLDTDFHPLLSRLRRERDKLTSSREAEQPELQETPDSSRVDDLPKSDDPFEQREETRHLVTEMLGFLRQVESAMQRVAASFTEAPVREATVDDERPRMGKFLRAMWSRPTDRRARDLSRT